MIPGLTQCFKDPALPQVTALVTDAAVVLHGSGVAVVVVWACSCSSDLTPSQGTSICCRCSYKKKNKREIVSFENGIL